MHKKTFVEHLVELAEPTNKRLSDLLIERWWRRFGALPDDLLIRAFDRAGDTCEWFPSPVQFASILESLMTPEERGVQEGIRLLRSWFARGVLPLGWSDAEYRGAKAALGLPPPTRAELSRLAERRATVGGGADLGEPGPALARLLGLDAPLLAAGGDD